MTSTVPKTSFAMWFRGLLDDRDVTQAEAARRLNISTGRISEWLSGKMIPSAASCVRIAKVFKVDEDEVLVAAGRRTADPHYDPDSAESQLLPYIRAIDWTERDLKMIKRQLEFLAEMKRGEHDR